MATVSRTRSPCRTVQLHFILVKNRFKQSPGWIAVEWVSRSSGNAPLTFSTAPAHQSDRQFVLLNYCCCCCWMGVVKIKTVTGKNIIIDKWSVPPWDPKFCFATELIDRQSIFGSSFAISKKLVGHRSPKKERKWSSKINGFAENDVDHFCFSLPPRYPPPLLIVHRMQQFQTFSKVIWLLLFCTEMIESIAFIFYRAFPTFFSCFLPSSFYWSQTMRGGFRNSLVIIIIHRNTFCMNLGMILVSVYLSGGGGYRNEMSRQRQMCSFGRLHLSPLTLNLLEGVG